MAGVLAPVNETNVPYLPSVGRLLGFAVRATTLVSERKLSAHDLTLQQWILLTALWRKDGLTISELAAYYRVKEPTASSLVDRMEVKGLVIRRRSTEDRRKVIVCLTDKSQALSHLISFYEEINEILFDGFSDDEQAAFISMMERLIANAESELNGGQKPADI